VSPTLRGTATQGTNQDLRRAEDGADYKHRDQRGRREQARSFEDREHPDTQDYAAAFAFFAFRASRYFRILLLATFVLGAHHPKDRRRRVPTGGHAAELDRTLAAGLRGDGLDIHQADSMATRGSRKQNWHLTGHHGFGKAYRR
jgi:hypothetical protein